MTREEAIADIRDNIKPIVGGKSLDMAIEALEQEPCADMVSRDAMWEVLQRLYGTEGELVEELMSLPPVLPMPKMGHWVKVIEENGHAFYLCSVCKEGTDKNYDWCPNCGAKLEVGNG